MTMDKPRTQHVSAESMADYLCHRLDFEHELDIEEHLANCDACADESRRMHALTMTLNTLTTADLSAAYKRATEARSSARRPQIVHTVRGWVSVEEAGRTVLTAGMRFGEWLVGSIADPPPALSGPQNHVLAISQSISDAGTLHLEVTPMREGGCLLLVRLGAEVKVRSLVVGLGDANLATFGTRTVTPAREQSFQVLPAEITDLHLHLEWESDGQRIRTAVLRLPLDVER